MTVGVFPCRICQLILASSSGSTATIREGEKEGGKEGRREGGKERREGGQEGGREGRRKGGIRMREGEIRRDS